MADNKKPKKSTHKPAQQAVNNPYRQCQFAISVNQLGQLPTDTGLEIAFAGRSNAGKSSAINVISDIKNLCRTSKTPGRTQMINYFNLDDEHRLVDLPGYGYAKVPEKVKHHWQQLLETYLQERESLAGLVVIMDIRRPLTQYDTQMCHWCYQAKMPLHVLLTKADKLKHGAAKTSLLQTRKALKEIHPEATIQLFSALKKQGVDEVLEKLNQWMEFEQE